MTVSTPSYHILDIINVKRGLFVLLVFTLGKHGFSQLLKKKKTMLFMLLVFTLEIFTGPATVDVNERSESFPLFPLY